MTEHPGAGRNLVSGLIGLLAVTVAVLMGWSSSEARSVVVVHCGDVITQDTKLGNDLVDCPADGLVIGADDVTLDLHGHTIDGVAQRSKTALCASSTPVSQCQPRARATSGS